MSKIEVERQRHTTILTINRPERMNSLDAETLSQLREAMREFEGNDDQYVAIITGAGDKAFCAGADLKWLADGASQGTRMPSSDEPDIGGVAGCEKVTIAAINGLCVAGGLELSICCDIRLASERAWFALPEPKRGLVAGVASIVLPRLMPMGAVMDMMLTGERLSAEDAFRLGLIQSVVPQGQLMEAALRKADMVAQFSQPAVWGTKQVVKFWRDISVAEQQRYFSAVHERVLLSGDVHEGPKAFVEKRDPAFINRWPDPFVGR